VIEHGHRHGGIERRTELAQDRGQDPLVDPDPSRRHLEALPGVSQHDRQNGRLEGDADPEGRKKHVADPSLAQPDEDGRQDGAQQEGSVARHAVIGIVGLAEFDEGQAPEPPFRLFARLRGKGGDFPLLIRPGDAERDRGQREADQKRGEHPERRVLPRQPEPGRDHHQHHRQNVENPRLNDHRRRGADPDSLPFQQPDHGDIPRLDRQHRVEREPGDVDFEGPGQGETPRPVPEEAPQPQGTEQPGQRIDRRRPQKGGLVHAPQQGFPAFETNLPDQRGKDQDAADGKKDFQKPPGVHFHDDRVRQKKER